MSPPPRARRGDLLGAALALPTIVWLVLFFVVPGYVVLCIAFGTVDPIFRAPLPAWNPVDWTFSSFSFVFDHLWGGPDAFLGPAFVRTVLYVAAAMVLCLLISYPVAWFVARHAGRWRGPLLALLVAPFWISYMMRMLAWVNLLQTDGLVNRALGLGLTDVRVAWLTGHWYTVVLGLAYGYVPYMILPLYAALDRISPSLIEAARDLGAGRSEVFRRVIAPMSLPGVSAGLILVALPMTGDYFTNDLLSGSPGTSMVGNLINVAVGTPGQAGQAGALISLLVLILLVPMLLYVRSTVREQDVRS